MNVFWLDEDPRLAARYHCDEHVNKMLLEAAQVLCSAAREHGLDEGFLYRSTHVDHPVTRWATESRANWLRLREHAGALNAEFRERYEKDVDHKSWTVIERIDPARIAFPDDDPTPRPQAMPEEHRRPGDTVEAYRTYYAAEKAPWGTWAHTPEPPWLEAYRPADEADETTATASSDDG